MSTPKLPNFPPSRPGTPDALRLPVTNGGHHPLHPTQPIVTPQQFYDWFAIVERTISHSQESHFRKHLQTVEEHLARCDLMRERVVEVESSVRSMLQEWRSVDEGAESLQAACERLLEERVRVDRLDLKYMSPNAMLIIRIDYSKSQTRLLFVLSITRS